MPLEPLDFNPDTVRHRLGGLGPAPCLLGLSGGGDSTALLLIAAGWARRQGATLIPVVIDHGVRPESAGEADRAVWRARQLGLSPVIIRWEGEKPATGLQAAARDFRLQTFARLANRHGAKTVLLGHTRDDQAETVWMRLQAGGGPDALCGMAMHSALPLWPEGRGVSIVRPLLDISRAQLRVWLTQQGENWVDDPSNDNRTFTRVRNRQTLARLAAEGFDPDALCALSEKFRAVRTQMSEAAAREIMTSVTLLGWGGVRLPADMAAPHAVKIMDAARAAASGDPVSRPEASRRLWAAFQAEKPATAGGAALSRHREDWYLVRDPGAVGGRADGTSGPVSFIEAGNVRIWDGRFEISGRNVQINCLGKAYPREISAESLAGIPPVARPGLPLMRPPGGAPGIPGITAETGGLAKWLAPELICRNLFEDRPPAWFDMQLRDETAQGSQ
ncbi:tRNA lysidine(34) synthetase TilS [Hyphobacterium indicum]|uniref:tRNA lysidine(34) synthetase TilS n=1 Tax=Hyphobacterium indicum TaxID=2162714 RepID=UPI0013752D93|nr:tRNA lysidine(34) synthetase TilS [Hyphobacterium indicum]